MCVHAHARVRAHTISTGGGGFILFKFIFKFETLNSFELYQAMKMEKEIFLTFGCWLFSLFWLNDKIWNERIYFSCMTWTHVWSICV